MVLPKGWTPAKGQLARILFDVGAVQFGEFKLKMHEEHPNAPLSPIFLNLRTADNPKKGPLTPAILDLIGQQLCNACSEAQLSFDHIAPVPNAGDPLARALDSHTEPLSIIWLDKTETEGKRKISGVKKDSTYKSRDKVLVVDDLITKADTKLEAIHSLEDEGLIVNDVLVLVDREQGGADELKSAGYKLISVFSLSDMLAFYVDDDKIFSREKQAVLTYRERCDQYFKALVASA